jgi:tetratricopeptide (TPR) repeat protein
VKNKKNFGKEPLDDEDESLISRYEDMQAHGGSRYFDVSECENIIDYYSLRCEMEKAMQAALWAEKLHPLSPSIQLIKASLLAFDGKPRKALNIIAHLEQLEYVHELDIFRLKISKAFALIAIGKNREALAIQHELLNSEAIGDVDAEYLLTVITNGLLEQEEFLEVVLNLRRFEGKIQFSPTLLGYMAHAYAEIDDLEDAVECYKKGIAQDPFDPALWCDMADLLEDADEALAAYDYALLLDEKMVQAYCGKAELLSEQNRTEEAGELLLKGVEVCPYDAELYDLLVEHYVDKEDYDTAMACCQKMMEKDPCSPSMWLSIARVFACMEKYEDALEACDTSMLLDEDMTTCACEMKAFIYTAMGLPDKELEMYTAMLQNEMYDVALVHEVSLIYEIREEYEVVYKILAAAIEVNPRASALYARMAHLLYKISKPEEAYRYAQHAVKLDDQSSFAWLIMAEVELMCGKQKKMLRSLKKALTCFDCNVGAIALFCEVAIGGKVPDILSLLGYAERAGIDNPIAHCYMAALFFSLNDMQKCLHRLEQALEMDPDNSASLFFEICPSAKKKTEVKRLCSAYRQANKKK